MAIKLLSEIQVRRFQALAEISSMKEYEPVEETIEEAEEAEETIEEAEEAEEIEEGGLAGRKGDPRRRDPARASSSLREEEEVSEGEAAEASSAAATGTATAALGGLGSAGLGAGLGKAVKVALQKEGLEGLDESQVRELVHRIRARILQENRQVQRFATREKKIFALETRMIREIESKRAAQNTEALIENLVSRVATRLRNIKDQ